jgi:hypothetical protein
MGLEEKLRTLTKEEAIALYWTCKGYRYGEIGDQKLHVTYGRVQQHMSKAYDKLGYEGPDNSAEHRKFLNENNVRDVLNTLIDGNIDVLETFPLLPKEETPVAPPPETVSEPPIAVEPVPTPTKAPTNDVSRPKGNRTLLWFSLGFLGLLVAFGYTAYYFYNLGQTNRPTVSTTPQITTVVITATSQPITETQVISPILPITATQTQTITPPPTSTPVPTNTPKPYYSENEQLALGERVYLFLEPDFNKYRCYGPRISWGVMFYAYNGSNHQFTLKFNTASFHAVDDVGTQYKLSGACIRNTNVSLGQDINYLLSNGYDTEINVWFDGEWPLPAHYLLITADWISGFGPVTFRKDL